jgi:hypothetical protein
MRYVLMFLLLTSTAFGQSPQTDTIAIENPQVLITSPKPFERFKGSFRIVLKNVQYRPELATNPVQEFAVGVDAAGDPLIPNDGHMHGWVLPVNWWNLRTRRDDGDKPTPSSYIRFYGAGNAEVLRNRNGTVVLRIRDDFEPGLYKAFFMAQRNDHTTMTQATAPALPAVETVLFWVF